MDDAHHPRGYTGKVGDTLGYSLVGNTQAFLLKVGKEGRGLGGHTEMIDETADVLDEDDTEVTDKTLRQTAVGLVASAEEEGLALEKAAVGIVAVEIECHAVGAAGIMDVLQPTTRDGDELRLVIRRPR